MWLTRNKWIIRYRVADKAWFVLSSHGGHVYTRCCTMLQAVTARAAIDIDPSTYDEFQQWKVKAGRACMTYSIQKLAHKRRETNHG